MGEQYRREAAAYAQFAEFLGEPRSCLVCGSTSKSVWAHDPPFTAQRCLKCTFVWIDPALTEEGLDRYYSNYVDFRMQDAKKLAQRDLMYDLDCRFLESHCLEGRLLDVGCSAGLFLEKLSPRFDKVGLERDTSAVQLARDRNPELGSRIRIGTLASDPFDEAEFDVVVMRGVIEHLLDPQQAVRRVAALLRRNGYFYVTATPNVDSFCAQLYRQKWNQFDAVQHVSYFSVPTLQSLCGGHGLRLIDYAFPYLETPYAQPREDLEHVLQASELVKTGGRERLERSPAFWGNMLTALFQREAPQGQARR